MPDCVPPVLSPAVPATGFPARSSSRPAQAPASGSITVSSWVAPSIMVDNPMPHVVAPGNEYAADHAGVRLIQPLHRCLGYFPARFLRAYHQHHTVDPSGQTDQAGVGINGVAIENHEAIVLPQRSEQLRQGLGI